MSVSDRQHSATPEPRSIRFEEALAAAIMALLTLLTLVNAATRYLGNMSLAFTEEISVFLIVLLTLVGTATAFARHRHLAITVVVDRLPPKLARPVKILSKLCSILIFAILGWYGTLMVWDDWYSEMTSPGLGIPQWIYSVWLPVIAIAIAIRLTISLWREGAES